MNKKRIMLVMSIVILLLTTTISVSAAGKSDLAKVKAATANFHRTEVAQAAGWDLVPGLDYCFNSQGTGAMGFHFINLDLFNAEVDPEQPEALVYAPGPNGQLQLAAVEYIVPGDMYDGQQVLGQDLHLNENLGVYVLHAWVWKNNPSGMFEDWNPNVSCP